MTSSSTTATTARPTSEQNSAIIEAQAIILFYQDELENLRWIAECDTKGNRSTGDKLGRDLDRWENHPEHVKDRFRQRARKSYEERSDG